MGNINICTVCGDHHISINSTDWRSIVASLGNRTISTQVKFAIVKFHLSFFSDQYEVTFFDLNAVFRTFGKTFNSVLVVLTPIVLGHINNLSAASGIPGQINGKSPGAFISTKRERGITGNCDLAVIHKTLCNKGGIIHIEYGGSIQRTCSVSVEIAHLQDTAVVQSNGGIAVHHQIAGRSPNGIIKLGNSFVSLTVGGIIHPDSSAGDQGIAGINGTAVEAVVRTIELNSAVGQSGTFCSITNHTETALAAVLIVVTDNEGFAKTADQTAGIDGDHIIITLVILPGSHKFTRDFITFTIVEVVTGINGHSGTDIGISGNIDPIIIGIVDGDSAFNIGRDLETSETCDFIAINITFNHKLFSSRSFSSDSFLKSCKGVNPPGFAFAKFCIRSVCTVNVDCSCHNLPLFFCLLFYALRITFFSLSLKMEWMGWMGWIPIVPMVFRGGSFFLSFGSPSVIHLFFYTVFTQKFLFQCRNLTLKQGRGRNTIPYRF